jgi:uncharacterized protein YndB with AHSA1/START domain
VTHGPGAIREAEERMVEHRALVDPIRRTVEVPCAAGVAFRIFTDEIDSWWPLAAHSVGRSRAVGCFFEGREGGRIYETLDDGSLHLWGTVTVWDPPRRVVFSWHPGRDADTAQEVELLFEDLAGGITRVELTHRDWEVLGERGAEIREAYQSGWPGVLESYVARCRLAESG